MSEDSDHKTGEPETARASSLFALLSDHDAAERAVHDLHECGCDMTKLSAIGRDYYTEQGVVGFSVWRGRATARGLASGFWARLWGETAASGFFLVPGIGPVFVAGTVVGRILGELENAAAVGGMNALGCALYGYGVPQAGVTQYEANIRAGTLVLIAHGSQEDVQRAREALAACACRDLSTYSDRA